LKWQKIKEIGVDLRMSQQLWSGLVGPFILIEDTVVSSKKMTKYELHHPTRGPLAGVKRIRGCRKKESGYQAEIPRFEEQSGGRLQNTWICMRQLTSV
jgi:hypothetical protein